MLRIHFFSKSAGCVAMPSPKCASDNRSNSRNCTTEWMKMSPVGSGVRAVANGLQNRRRAGRKLWGDPQGFVGNRMQSHGYPLGIEQGYCGRAGRCGDALADVAEVTIVYGLTCAEITLQGTGKRVMRRRRHTRAHCMRHRVNHQVQRENQKQPPADFKCAPPHSAYYCRTLSFV